MRETGMASGGGSLEEVFTGPWDPYMEGNDPFDLEGMKETNPRLTRWYLEEGRDEETLPLTDVGADNRDREDTNPFVKGPS